MAWRLFLATVVPIQTRGAVAAWIETQRRALTSWRWIDPEVLHLTLRFLGETDPARVEGLRRALEPVVHSTRAHHLEVAGWGTFPSRRRARILWCGLDGALQVTGRSVAHSLGYAAQQRDFRPHLTLARASVERPLAPLHSDGRVFGPLPLDRVVLYRSHLRPDRARYEAFRDVPLGVVGGIDA